jgi:hypothetical protein
MIFRCVYNNATPHKRRYAMGCKCSIEMVRITGCWPAGAMVSTSACILLQGGVRISSGKNVDMIVESNSTAGARTLEAQHETIVVPLALDTHSPPHDAVDAHTRAMSGARGAIAIYSQCTVAVAISRGSWMLQRCTSKRSYQRVPVFQPTGG